MSLKTSPGYHYTRDAHPDSVDNILANIESQLDEVSELSPSASDHLLEQTLSVCNSTPSHHAARALILLDSLLESDTIISRFRPSPKNLLRMNLPFYISSSNDILRTHALHISLTLLTRFSSLQIDDISTDQLIQSRILNHIAFDSRDFLQRQFSLLSQSLLSSSSSDNHSRAHSSSSLDVFVEEAVATAINKHFGTLEREFRLLKGAQGEIMNQAQKCPSRIESLGKSVESLSVKINKILGQNSMEPDLSEIRQRLSTLETKKDSVIQDSETCHDDTNSNYLEEITNLSQLVNHISDQQSELIADISSLKATVSSIDSTTLESTTELPTVIPAWNHDVDLNNQSELDSNNQSELLIRKLKSLETDIGGVHKTFTGYDRLFQVFQKDIDLLKGQNSKNNDRVSLIQTRMGVTEDEVSAFEGKIKHFKELLRKVDVKVDSFENFKILTDNLQHSLASMRERIKNLEESVEDKFEIFDDLVDWKRFSEQKLTDLNTSIPVLLKFKEEMSEILPKFRNSIQECDSMSSEVSKNLNNLQSFDSDLSTLKSTINDLNSQILSQSKSITTLESSINESSTNQEQLSDSISILASAQTDLCNALEHTKSLLSAELDSKLSSLGNSSLDPSQRFHYLEWGYNNRMAVSWDRLEDFLNILFSEFYLSSSTTVRKLKCDHHQCLVAINETMQSNLIDDEELALNFLFCKNFLLVDANLKYFVENRCYRQFVTIIQRNLSNVSLVTHFLNISNLISKFDHYIEHLINEGFLMILKQILSLDSRELVTPTLVQSLVVLRSVGRLEFSIPYLLEFEIFEHILNLCANSQVFNYCTKNLLSSDLPANGEFLKFCEHIFAVLKCFAVHADGCSTIISSEVFDFCITTTKNSDQLAPPIRCSFEVVVEVL
ncbi:hypothetical protein GEMRC1_011340 [Eukaryota sp. GEM-RC1]